MTEERLIEMLSNDTLRKVKSVAKTCMVSTVGSKMDIIMRINVAALKEGKKCRKIYSKIWSHSGGWLSFSCPHGVVYYLKFLLRSETSRDYVDRLLSMEHLPNITVIDLAHIGANHALVSRKEDVIKYGCEKIEFYLNPTPVELQIQKTQKMLQVQLRTVWKCHSHESASIIKANYPEMMQDKNAIKSTR